MNLENLKRNLVAEDIERHLSEQQFAFDLKQIVTGKRLVGLWRMLTGFRLFYLGALVSIAISVTARTLNYSLLQYVIDDVLDQQAHLDRLPLLALAFVGLAVLEGSFAYLRSTWAARAAEGITVRLRNYLFDHLQRLSFTYHDHARTGDLIQRVTSDVDAVRRFYAEQATTVGQILALFLINFVAVVRMNTRLGLLAVVTMPVVVAMSYAFFGKISKAYDAYQDQEAKLSTTLQENLMGVRVVKAFARQRYEIDKFDRDNWEKYRRGKRLSMLHSLYWPLSDTICSAQTLLVLVLGALMVMRSEMTLGTYVAISGMIVWIVWPMRNLGRLIVQVSTGMVSYERVSAIIAEEREDLVAGSFHLEGRPLRGEVIFEDVRFAYAPAPVDGEGSNGHGDREIKDVLQDISFRVQPGQKIALLGATGSGKTSIVNLLLRFYEHNAGHIWLDGVELREYSKGELRRQIGVVEQEPFLFSRSIRENIAYGAGRPVTDEEVVEAARSAAIHDVILTFPKGYDTLIGEKGVTLSGGQRQRIAIARTLLKDPRLLILDAATSSVDTETEMQIDAALDRLMEGRTSFIIAHRIQSVMRADLILVLDGGRVVQQGTHETLAREEGLYKTIYELQSRIEQEVEREIEVSHVGL